jgi:hypothetical protein
VSVVIDIPSSRVSWEMLAVIGPKGMAVSWYWKMPGSLSLHFNTCQYLITHLT